MTREETIMTHADRIKRELKAAGVSSAAIHRFTCRYLPKIIHETEHIKAAVFGHRKTGPGIFDFMDGVLVATDSRVIYLDHSLGYTTIDEVSYDVISGLNITKTGILSSVTLYTKLGNYTISFARYPSIQLFAEYIETRRVGHLADQKEFTVA